MLNGNVIFAGVFALLLAAPKYLAGELTLGSLMQLGAAFVSVLSALNWFADNYIPVAQWRASARRVALLVDALSGLNSRMRRARSGDCRSARRRSVICFLTASP